MSAASKICSIKKSLLVILVLTAQMASGNNFCGPLFLKLSSYPLNLIEHPENFYPDWEQRILSGGKFPEFEKIVLRMLSETQAAQKVETDTEIKTKIFRPLEKDLKLLLSNGIEYKKFLILVTRFVTAMDIRLDYINEDLHKIHQAVKRESELYNINPEYYLANVPPIDLSLRKSWHQQRINWLLKTHPGNPKDVLKNLGKGLTMDAIQLPMFEALDFLPFVKLWSEGFSPTWINLGISFEGASSATLTHDWRHSTGRVVKYSDETKFKLRTLLSAVENIADNKKRDAVTLIVFDYLHEHFRHDQPTLGLDELLGSYKSIQASLKRNGYGTQMKNSLEDFPEAEWISACHWIADTFEKTRH